MLLWCVYPGVKLVTPGVDDGTSFSSFRLEADPEDFVDEILQKVKSKLQKEDLSLYKFKANIPVNLTDEELRHQALSELHQQGSGDKLHDREIVGSYFPGEHNRRVCHILVACPEVYEVSETLGNPDLLFKKRLIRDVLKNTDKLKKLPAPSAVVSDAAVIRSVMSKENRSIFLNHLPVSLFSPIFATLEQELTQLDQAAAPPKDTLSAAIRFFAATVTFYAKEDARQLAINKEVNELMSSIGEWKKLIYVPKDRRITPDSTWWREGFVTAILELKNNLGLVGDAMLQTLLDYSALVTRKEMEPHIGECNFPAILLGISGNRIEISVAIFIGAVYASKLFTIDLSPGFHASKQIVLLANAFMAVSNALQKLDQFYITRSAPAPDSDVDISALFPNPTMIHSAPVPPTLFYRQFLAPDGAASSTALRLGDRMTMLYMATLDNGNQNVVVKFTATYCKEAHILLAEAGFAPKLHFCEHVVGGLYMVVMDHVPGDSVWKLRHGKRVGHEISGIILDSVQQAVECLHQSNWVFGDLRDTNVVYCDMVKKAFLVDFDWAGKENLGHYPALLNMSNRYAEGVHPGGIMLKEHDTWQLQKLQEMLSRN